MKNIKSLFLICLLSLLVLNCFAQDMKVGEVKRLDPRGDLNVIVGEDRLKTTWEAELREHKIPVELVNFEIVPFTDKGKVEYYMLTASNADGTVNMASVVEMRGNSFYLPMVMTGTRETCICAAERACETGCGPYRIKEWSCGGGLGNCKDNPCTKIVTVRDEKMGK